MKMIKPIVNLSKIAENYDTYVLGFNGVISDGAQIYPEAAKALSNLKLNGKNLILISNTHMRIVTLVKILSQNGISPDIFSCIMTAGEIMHYKLKSPNKELSAIGNHYYHLGNQSDKGVFFNLNYQPVANIESAHFLYMSEVSSPQDLLENYLPQLDHAVSLGLPFICAGNNTSCYINGQISIAPAALAEQYAILGGQLITIGKPSPDIFKYCLDGIKNLNKVLVIGNNIATDIKGAGLLGLDSVLISKGIHINFLGEGYIPDVAKTRELSNSYDASPNYVISNLRW